MNPASALGAPDPLAGLRGYHLPEPPSWWPPAPGWWVLAAAVLIAVAVLAFWYTRRRRRQAAAHQARHELKALRRRFDRHGDAVEYVRELSKLLRRYAVTAFPRRDVAALTGNAWLDFLDRHAGNAQFIQGVGRQLIDAPYKPAASIDVEQLAALVDDWIRRNREVAA